MSPPTSPVAVIGAGYLGRALACALPPPVIAVSRRGHWDASDNPENPVARPPAGVRLQALDLLNAEPAKIRHVLAEARSLVICIAPGPTQDRKKLYLQGTARLLHACAGLRLARVIYTSSTSALPDCDGWVDDDPQTLPSEPRGQLQRAAEDQVRSHCQAYGWPWLILRLAGLYGPGRELFRLYRTAPATTLPGDGMQATNLIHRDDAVQACIAGLALPPTMSTAINICDDDHRPRRVMFAAMARAADHPEPTWELPPSPQVRGKHVANTRMKQLLGLTLAYPLHQLPGPEAANHLTDAG